MALDPVVNFFQSEIATLPVSDSGVTIVISSGDGAKLPNPAVDGAFNLTIYKEGDPFASPEIVRVTARSTDTLTVTRAQEGSIATTKTEGSTWKVVMFPTAKTIQDIDSTKVNVADIVNNLTSTDTNKPLSANQGKVLQDNKVATASIVNDLTSGGTTVPLSAEQGKVLQDGKVAKAGDTMTGTLTATKLIPSGNVTAGNGMYLPATNTVAFSTNGNERVRFDASGNVGIGVTPFAWGSNYNSIDIAPASSISGTKNVPSTIIATNGFFDGSVFKYKSSNPASAINQFDGGHSFFTAPSGTAGNTITFTERMTITSAGDVGIGTTSPGEKLHIVGNQRVQGNIDFFNATPNLTLQIIPATSIGGTNPNRIATINTTPIAFETGLAERLRITSAGDVGIGTTAPASRLDVNGQVTIMSRTRILNKIISTDNSNVTVLTVTAPNVDLFAQIEINIIHSRAPNTLQGTGAHGKFYITIARQLNGNTVALYDSTNSFVASGANGGGGINSTLNTPTFTSPSGASSATQTIDVQIQASTGGGGTGGQFTLKTELLTTNGSVLIA
jgi:hypothetical protein